MQEVKINGTINTTARKVWNLVSDFGALDTFVESIKECSTDGQNVETIRVLTLQDGVKVKEKLESLDNEKRVLTYSIIESPLPIKKYLGRVEVIELSDRTSEFIWSSTFETADGTEKEMEQALTGLYSEGVEGLKKKFS